MEPFVPRRDIVVCFRVIRSQFESLTCVLNALLKEAGLIVTQRKIQPILSRLWRSLCALLCVGFQIILRDGNRRVYA